MVSTVLTRIALDDVMIETPIIGSFDLVDQPSSASVALLTFIFRKPRPGASRELSVD